MILFDEEQGDLDRALFALELNLPINEDTDSAKNRGMFIKNRKMLVPLLKDFRKRNKGLYQGKDLIRVFNLRRWNRSAEGKQFHRQLGRFLSLRMDRPSMLGTQAFEEAPLSQTELKNLYKALIQESHYFRSPVEQAELEVVAEEIFSAIK